MFDFSFIKDRLSRYENIEPAYNWFKGNYERVNQLFNNKKIRDFVFEPFVDVFNKDNNLNISDRAYLVITQVALANMVLAGLPGKLGVGVFVSMGLEIWMAYEIAKHVGVKIEGKNDLLKYFGLLTSIMLIVIEVFRLLLSFIYSLFSIIPGVNPLILAELFVTDLVGILFLIGFNECKSSGTFVVPKRLYKYAITQTSSLFKYQFGILKNVASPQALKQSGKRIYSWLKGEIPLENPLIRGELFPTAAMMWLVSGKTEAFDGPMGELFIQSIRDRYPTLENSSIEEISAFMQGYGTHQLEGVLNLIKGKLFERMVELHENSDVDDWHGKLHEDEMYPGSDIIFTNHETGEQIEVSLKATINPDYIETALLKYPDIPIMTTEEISDYFKDEERVSPGPFSYAEVDKITKDNFDDLVNRLDTAGTAEVAAGGVGAAASVSLWPFVIAYTRGRISQEQLTIACVKVLGTSGKALASRLAYAVILGPVFAWYLLARGTLILSSMAVPKNQPNKHIIYSDTNTGTKWHHSTKGVGDM